MLKILKEEVIEKQNFWRRAKISITKKIEQLFKVKIEPVEFISFNRNDENISFEKSFLISWIYAFVYGIIKNCKGGDAVNYIGSKYSLMDFLTMAISEVVGNDADNRTFADLFAGTGVVGSTF